MDSEKEVIISFIFKRSGKKEMSFSEFYLTLSIDLNWSTPEVAKKLMQQMIKEGLLLKEKENIKPGFDINNIKIPAGFPPSKQAFKEEQTKQTAVEVDILTTIIKKIVEKTNEKQQIIFEKIKKLAEEKNIKIEVAALFFGKEHHLVFDEVYVEIENKILLIEI